MSKEVQRAEIESDKVSGEIFFDGGKLFFRPQGTIESPRMNRDPSRGVSLQPATSSDGVDEYKGLVDTRNFGEMFSEHETNLAVSGVLEAIRNGDERVKYKMEEPDPGYMNLKVEYEIMPKIWRTFDFDLSSPAVSRKNPSSSFSLKSPPRGAKQRSKSVGGQRRAKYDPLHQAKGKKPQKGKYKAVPKRDDHEEKIDGGEPKGYSLEQKNSLIKHLKKSSAGTYVVRRSWDKKTKKFDRAIFVVTYKEDGGKIRHHKVRYFDDGYGAEMSGKGDVVSTKRYKTIDEYVKGEVSEATTPIVTGS